MVFRDHWRSDRKLEEEDAVLYFNNNVHVICSESSNGTFVLVKEIEGGEHAGFGYYDSCKGDSGGPAWVEILTEANYRSRLAHVTGKHQMFIYSRTWRPWLWRSELSAGDQTVQCRRKTLNRTTGVSVWYIFLCFSK